MKAVHKSTHSGTKNNYIVVLETKLVCSREPTVHKTVPKAWYYKMSNLIQEHKKILDERGF